MRTMLSDLWYLFGKSSFLSGMTITYVISMLFKICLPVYAQQNPVPQRLTGARELEAATHLSYLFEGQTAIRLMPAEPAIGQGVTRAEWSPDGRYVVAVRVPLIADPQFALPVSVVLWDKTTHRSTELWNRRLAAPELSGQIWAAKVQVCVLHWRWMEADENGAWGVREGMVWADAARGTARELTTHFGDTVFLSPMLAGGILLHSEARGILHSIRVISPDGSMRPPILVSDDVQQPSRVLWQADGKQCYLEMSVPITVQDKNDIPKGDNQGTKGRRRNQWYAVDLLHSQIVALDKEPADVYRLPDTAAFPKPVPGTSSRALHVAAVSTELKHGSVEIPLHALWLETGGPTPMSALLCADGTRAQIAPSGDAVLYLEQTRVWVTALQRTPRPIFTASILATHQDDVKYRAWTLAQAVRMWSAAHEGILPTSDEALTALQSLMPTEALYAGFRYVWVGGALPVGVRPAYTVVAEILGPGGCAQIFADGHSAWNNNK